MEVELRDLLYQAVWDFAQEESIPAAFPNESFIPGNRELYIEAATIPTSPEVLTVKSGGSRYTWLCQISIYVRDDNGEILPLAVADKIRVAFPVTRKLTGANHVFTVVTPPAPVPPVDSQRDGWFLIPVRFRVQTIH